MALSQPAPFAIRVTENRSTQALAHVKLELHYSGTEAPCSSSNQTLQLPLHLQPATRFQCL